MVSTCLFSVLLVGASACSSKEDKKAASEPAGKAAPAQTEATPSAEAKPAGPPKPPKPAPEPTDKGEASMTIGTVEWTAQKSYARQKGEVLLIKASYTDSVDGRVKRQELHIEVTGYKGPGEYTTALSGSRFIGVGMDADTARKAAGNSAAEKRELHNALSAANHMMLSEMKVTITEASETEVKGSFEWKSPDKKKPSIEKGSFRAPLRD